MKSFSPTSSPVLLAPMCSPSQVREPASTLDCVDLVKTTRRRGRGAFVALSGALLLIATSCSGGETEKAERPDATEMMRRARLVTAEFGRTLPAGADPTTLTCIMDVPYDEFGYQLGYRDSSVETSVMAEVVACSEDEWPELAEAIATLHQVDDVAAVRQLVARAIEAQMP